jgi:hypothetical protein
MQKSHIIKEPQWPKERNLARYDALAGFKIQKYLSRGGLWIDIGVGKGARPMRPLLRKPGVKLKAISPHHRSLPAGISLTIGQVPEHTGFLAENRGRARLVTDVFGALSYCDDPVQSLIYGALLLRTNGVFVAFTELRRLGNLETWDRITQFFHRRLNQDISFQTVFVLGDSSGLYSTYLRVCIQGKATPERSLSNLFKQARHAIGAPRRTHPLWESSDKSAKIWRVDYSGER